jgi:hypothetical protein
MEKEFYLAWLNATINPRYDAAAALRKSIFCFSIEQKCQVLFYF